jgi:uncharacterized protein (TIGR01777 family)
MKSERRVVVTGATGLIGKRLTKELTSRGYSVTIFSRNPEKARSTLPGAAEYVAWQPGSADWVSHIDGAYAVINLAGAGIFNRRWTKNYKKKILESRVQGTRGLVDAMARAKEKPQVLINGSAVGYYGLTGSEKLDEASPPGDDFLARVVLAWEREAAKAEALGVRVVMLRSGIVLAREGGALPLMSLPFKLFVGGPILPGDQYFSWVHIDDEVGIILMVLENDKARGPINSSAPEPQTNRDFSRALGKAFSRPSLLPVPGFALKVALGEVSSIITGGQRVIPNRAQELGYRFLYPTSDQALTQIFKK